MWVYNYYAIRYLTGLVTDCKITFQSPKSVIKLTKNHLILIAIEN